MKSGRKLDVVLRNPGERALLTLPTGAGKTRVVVESIRDWLTQDRETTSTGGPMVLWLAHTDELCEQAYLCFKQVWTASEEFAGHVPGEILGGYRGTLRDSAGL